MSSLNSRSKVKRRFAVASTVAAAAAAACAMGAPSAQAAFSLTPCTGSNVGAQGGSFQNAAQAYFAQQFAGNNGCGGVVSTPPSITSYRSNGSGNGLAAMGAGGGNATLACAVAGAANPCTAPLAAGVRDASTPFTTVDDPPSTTQQAAINAGTASPTDNGRIHVIPAVTGAATIIVNLPAGCTFDATASLTGDTADQTGDTRANFTARPKIPNSRLEAAFAGDTSADTWGELVPGITGTATSPQQASGAACGTLPVKRIVRSDVSGTTFAFKAFLGLAARAPGGSNRPWTTDFATPDNTYWPSTGGKIQPTRIDNSSASTQRFCPSTAPGLLCSALASQSGNGALATLVGATDGSLGYNDLATSRANFSTTPGTAGDPTTQDRTIWLPVENNPGGTPTRFVEPTADPGAHTTANTARGAACGDVTVRNAPTTGNSPNGDPTLGDWSTAFAAGGPGYSNCVISYVLAWDDNAAVYGNSPAEEQRARTVKDYVSFIVNAGQALTAQDYSPVPNPPAAPLATFARTAVAAIDWNKTGASGGGTPPPANTNTTPAPAPDPVEDTPTTTTNDTPPTQPVPVPVPVPTPVPTPAPAPAPAAQATVPSSAFMLAKGKANKARSSVIFAVSASAAGQTTVKITARVGGKTRTVGTATKSVSSSGKVSVRVKLSAAARKAARTRKGITLKVRATFTPTGGTAATKTASLKLRR